jgi:hypothetical protein
MTKEKDKSISYLKCVVTENLGLAQDASLYIAILPEELGRGLSVNISSHICELLKCVFLHI